MVERKCALVLISHSLVSLISCKRLLLWQASAAFALWYSCLPAGRRSLGQGFFTHAYWEQNQYPIDLTSEFERDEIGFEETRKGFGSAAGGYLKKKGGNDEPILCPACGSILCKPARPN